MNEFKDRMIYLAFFLGLSNVIIGSTSKIFFIEVLRQAKPFTFSALSNCGYIIGALFSEYYSKKFRNQGLLFIWIGFFISGILIVPCNIFENETSKNIALIGVTINYFCQCLMTIVEIKCIKPVLKKSKSKYCLALLYSMNQLTYFLIICLKSLCFWLNFLIFFAGIIYSIIVSSRYIYKKSSFIKTNEKMKTILPFSAFVTESFGFGVFYM